jgi:hypothetical protein
MNRVANQPAAATRRTRTMSRAAGRRRVAAAMTTRTMTIAPAAGVPGMTTMRTMTVPAAGPATTKTTDPDGAVATTMMMTAGPGRVLAPRGIPRGRA